MYLASVVTNRGMQELRHYLRSVGNVIPEKVERKPGIVENHEVTEALAVRMETVVEESPDVLLDKVLAQADVP